VNARCSVDGIFVYCACVWAAVGCIEQRVVRYAEAYVGICTQTRTDGKEEEPY
jgi:hypothetical protein